jgi:hypothetical protein
MGMRLFDIVSDTAASRHRCPRALNNLFNGMPFIASGYIAAAPTFKRILSSDTPGTTSPQQHH